MNLLLIEFMKIEMVLSEDTCQVESVPTIAIRAYCNIIVLLEYSHHRTRTSGLRRRYIPLLPDLLSRVFLLLLSLKISLPGLLFHERHRMTCNFKFCREIIIKEKWENDVCIYLEILSTILCLVFIFPKLI